MRRELLTPMKLVFSWMMILTGCGGVPLLPDVFEVATSTTDRVEAEAGTGPMFLANSVWTLTREPDPSGEEDVVMDDPPPGPYGGILQGEALSRPPVGSVIARVTFGPDGEMTQVAENQYFLARIYGTTIPVGGAWKGTTLPRVAYRSASYGAEVGGGFGLAVVVHVRWGNVFLGRAVLYAWGTTGDAELAGTFGYLLDFTDGIVPSLGTIADQYPMRAELEEE